MQDLSAAPERCLGIIAGAGPDAGLTFWRKVLTVEKQRLGAAYRGDLDAPRVRIVSEPTLGYVMRMDTHHGVLYDSLRGLLGELGVHCDRIVLACHALQGLASDAASEMQVEQYVSLPALVCDYVRKNGLGRVGLLGAPSVTSSKTNSPYGALWDVADVEVPGDQADILDLILTAKRVGASHPDVLSRLSAALSAYSADTVLLACTDFSDLPLEIPGKRIVDIMDIAAQSVIQPV